MEISKKLNKLLLKHQAIIFTSAADTLYLTKFQSSNMVVIYALNKWYAITDERYLEAARKNIKHMKVMNVAEQPYKQIIKLLDNAKVTKIAVDKNKTTVGQAERLSTLIGPSLQLVYEDFSEIRQIKSRQEIMLAKKAAKITDKIFSEIIKFIKPGKTELQVKKKLLQLIYDTKASGPSFDPIVAAGANGSKPHWKSTEYKIKSGDLVTIDFGIIFENIMSDMTRTVCAGKLPNAKQQEVYQIVLEAQIKAIKAIKPGVRAKDIDKIAREHIEHKGFGRYFTHGLGHSFGIEVHETPRLNQKDETILEQGMLLTVEPGIYLSGQYGIRIEDDIVVTRTGCEILNKSSKKLEVCK